MRQFKVLPEGLKAIKKQTLLRTIPMMLLSICATVYILFMQSNGVDSPGDVLMFGIPAIVIIMGLLLFTGMRQLQTLVRSYVLTVGDDFLKWEQAKTPPIVISFKDIGSVVKRAGGMIIIYGKQKGEVISIPVYIEDAAYLENLLNNIQPIADKPLPVIQRYRMLIGVFNAVLVALAYTSENKIVTVAAGAGAIGILIWRYFIARNNKDIDERAKRNGNWVWVLAAIVIVVVVIRLFS